MTTRLRAATAWALFALAWVAAIAIAVTALPLSRMIEHTSLEPAGPVSSTAGSRETDLRRAVIVSISRDLPDDVKSTVSGLVTAVYAAPGDVLGNGDAFIEVNGSTVLSYRGSRPLWRDLAEGDSGEDVRNLGEFLVELGLMDPSSADDAFGPATRRAVIALQKKIGAEPDGVMRTAYLSFMPGDAPVLEVLVRVGDAIDSQVVTATLSSPVSGVAIRGQDGVNVSELRDQPLELSLGEKQISLTSLDVGPDQFDALADVFASAAPLDEENSTLREYDGAMIKLQTPLSVGTVPASSVFVDSDGTACIFAGSASGDSWEAVDALSDTQSVEAGVTYIKPEYATSIILSNPANVLGPSARC